MASPSPTPTDTTTAAADEPSSPLPSSPAPPTAASRRFPPPCWTPEEVLALIDAYRDKWYSLRRRSLKAAHWQDVADAVFTRCPTASPPKTALQCRHKMEKLRKRYRTELQRARSMPVSRLFTSSWLHFKLMDDMEKGPPAKPQNCSSGDDDDDDSVFFQGLKNGTGNRSTVQKLFRIPNGVSVSKAGTDFYRKVDHQKINNLSPSLNLCGNSGSGARVLGKRNRESEREDENDEMVAAIKALGDGFVKMEKMKMEMAREIQRMRMEMEIKRTEMILESQHQIVQAFAKTVSEKKINRKK